MKTVMKVTSVLNIIFGLHYLAWAIIAIFVTGFSSLVSLATFSTKVIGGTFGLILLVIFSLILTVIYGMGGIWTLKGDKKKALISMLIAAGISFIWIIFTMIHPKVKVTFLDIVALVLPIVHGFLIVQTEE